MSRPDPPNQSGFVCSPKSIGPALFGMALVLPLVVMIALLPWPVVLPAFSVWSLATAAAIVLCALTCRAPHRRNAVNAWDLAGAFAFIGCAAGILGEVEHMVD